MMWGMAQSKRPDIDERDLVGFKYFKKVLRLLDRLHDAGCARDRAHNRQLHCDQYTTLILLHLFNPILSSLRGMQQASELKKVQRKLKVPRSSLGSLSEASRVFDSDLLIGLIGELADQLQPLDHDGRLDDVRGILTLIDGTTLSVLPRLTEAMWGESSGKGLKLHTHFELLKGVPTRMDVTDAGAGERAQLDQTLLADRVYVMDRGYASFDLFQAIEDAESSFVCRLRDNSVYEVVEERPLGAEAQQADVLSDQRVSMNQGRTTLRLLRIKCTPHRKRYKIGRGGPEQGEALLIATNLLDTPAEVVALIYRRRWAIEIFFRFFKHVLGCRHLLSQCVNGIEIQVYAAIIACLLIALWTGRKPTLRTYEMICFYFTGLADEEELTAHIDRLAQADAH
jgi:hypothetical protein